MSLIHDDDPPGPVAVCVLAIVVGVIVGLLAR